MARRDPLLEANERLLQAIRDNLPALEALLKEATSHWGYEDPVYRFYHQYDDHTRSVANERSQQCQESAR